MKILPIFFCCSLFALPQSPSSVAGQFEASYKGGVLEIKALDRTILNWEEFSIFEGEKAVFTVDGAILNRVIGNGASSIFGELICNGNLFLINPAGVVFGPNAKVETGSFLASALDVLDEDFLSGADLHLFSSSSQGIENRGTLISQGNIALIGMTVLQEGICEAMQGEVLLASCQEAILASEDFKIRITPRAMDQLREEGIHCGGIIRALEMRASADGNLSRLAINLDGVVEASQLLQEGGKILLEADRGEICLQGEMKAPEISVEAARIGLGNGARLNLAGEQGGDCRIEATEWIAVGPSAEIDVRGADKGGRAVLFADGMTFFDGTINARGENVGGFVEVSGGVLNFKGQVETASADGKTGSLLLDPFDIIITNAVTTGTVTAAPTFSPTGGNCLSMAPPYANLQDSDLVNALMANPLVTIDTTGMMGMCPGDIRFDASATVVYNSSNELRLIAAGGIQFDTSVINNGNGNITISQAGSDVIVNATTTSVDVTTNGGVISITNVAGNLEILGGTSVGAFARISTDTAAVDIDIAGDLIITGGTMPGTNATLQTRMAPMTITADDIVITGTAGNTAQIFDGTNGTATINCQTMTLSSLFMGSNAQVSADLDLHLFVNGGNLLLDADNGGSAAANGSFNIEAVVSNDIILNGMNGGFATMFGDKANVDITATNGSILMNGSTQIYSSNQVNSHLYMTAGVDIQVNGTGAITSFTNQAEIVLVVDNLFPTSPGFGPGQFILSAGSVVDGSVVAGVGSPIAIYTADPSQNQIQGTLNGVAFVQGPPLTDTDNERYGVYFDALNPIPFFVSDYVLYYKTPIPSPPIPVPVPVIVALVQPELTAFSELAEILHPFSEYIYGALRFTETFESTAYFYLRQRSLIREWFDLENDLSQF